MCVSGVPTQDAERGQAQRQTAEDPTLGPSLPLTPRMPPSFSVSLGKKGQAESSLKGHLLEGQLGQEGLGEEGQGILSEEAGWGLVMMSKVEQGWV